MLPSFSVAVSFFFFSSFFLIPFCSMLDGSLTGIIFFSLYFQIQGKKSIFKKAKIHCIGLCAFCLNTLQNLIFNSLSPHKTRTSLVASLHTHTFLRLYSDLFCCLLSLLFSIIYWFFVVVKLKSFIHQTE